jgi:CBS domain-containing protein
MDVPGTARDIVERKGAQVWTISPEATVYAALQLMAEKNVGALVVLERKRLMGMMTERDYTRKVILQGKSSKATKVGEIMTSPADHVTPGESVEECMRRMTDRRIRHLPVVEERKLLGLVSMGDLVNCTICTQREAIHHMEEFINGRYPG